MAEALRSFAFRGRKMDDLTIQIDDRAFLRQLTNLEIVQLPFAGAMALNDTAYDALKHIQQRMDVVFDRPTRFTKNALFVWRANKNNLEAQVKERPSMGPRHFLKVQEAGGARPQTGLEKLMASRLAYAGILAAVVPASGAKLDGYGNWSPGERNVVLSSLGAQRDVRSNTTAASKKRKPNRAKYFVPTSGLAPGVYKRDGSAAPVKVLSFLTSLPSYTKRLGFYEGTAEIWEARLPIHLRRRLDEAVATAK